MCGVVLLGALGLLLYAQGILVSQYYKPLILAGFVGTALRRPVRCVAEMLRWSPATECAPDWTVVAVDEAEMPEWAYWRWLGMAYVALALIHFPGSAAATAMVLVSLYSGVATVVRAVKHTWIAQEVRQRISDWRHVLAKLAVVMSFFLLVVVGLSLCAYHLVTELKMLRSFALDGSMHSHTVATVRTLSGWSEEEIANIVRQRSIMLSDYMRGQFEDLIGDKQLANDLEDQVLRPFVLEALQLRNMNVNMSGTQSSSSSSAAEVTTDAEAGAAPAAPSLISSFLQYQDMYKGALGSSLLWSEHTQQLLSRLLVHTYRLLLEGVGYALAGIDFLFACTLFSSWLWMCLDDDVIECTIVRTPTVLLSSAQLSARLLLCSRLYECSHLELGLVCSDTGLTH